MQFIIEIPAGAKFIDANDLLGQIVEKVCPQLDVSPKLTALKKKIPTGEKGGYELEELSKADWKLLDKIWAGLPPAIGAPYEKFWFKNSRGSIHPTKSTEELDADQAERNERFAETHMHTFEFSKIKPRWEIHPIFDSGICERKEARHYYYELLLEAVKNGVVKVFTPSRRPTKNWDLKVEVEVKTARAYLQTLRFELLEVTPSVNIDDTTLRIHHEAANIWRNWKKMGGQPSAFRIRGDLAKCCEENKIQTKGGTIPNAEYLYRHFISKKFWTPPVD